MRSYKLEVMDQKEVDALGADLSISNEVIVETAGFIPLEVKFKQFEQNGIINQLRTSDFTSCDYRQLYLHPDFDVTPEDDLEEIQAKLDSLREFQKDYIQKMKLKKNLDVKSKVMESVDKEQNKVNQTEQSKE